MTLNVEELSPSLVVRSTNSLILKNRLNVTRCPERLLNEEVGDEVDEELLEIPDVTTGLINLPVGDDVSRSGVTVGATDLTPAR